MRFIANKVSKEELADLKAIYTAHTQELALLALNAFELKWGQKMHSVTKIWRDNWHNILTLFGFP